jgi:hypothetical protein
MCMKSMMIRQSGLVNSACTKSIRGMRIRDVNREPFAFCMQCCAYKKHKIVVKGHQSGAPFFTRCCACKKHKMDVRDINQEPLAFCTRRCACKKYKIDVRDDNRRPLLFVRMGSLTVHVFRSESLASIGNTYC